MITNKLILLKQFKNKLKYKITVSMMSNTNTAHTMSSSNTDNEMFDIENEQYIETPWDIIGSYFQGHHLERFVRHQIESYNNFVGYQIIKTIEMFNPLHIASEQDYDPVSKKHSLEIDITFENFHIYRPQIHENNGAIKLMFPQEARLRNFTYASCTTIDLNIRYTIRNGPNLENVQTFYKNIPKVHIGKLPIMLKSNICVLSQYKHFENTQTGECKYDSGGYFIINGSEKTVLGQERAAENKVYCFNVSKNNTKYTWLAELKSVPDFKCISPKQVNMMISSKNNGFGNAISIQLPRIKQPIPLFIVFRALGVISDKDICSKILLNLDDDKNKKMLDALQASIIEANKHLTQEECIKYITSFAMYTPINMDKETGIKKKYDFTLDILSNDLFPHCHNITQKIYLLGYMTNKLILASLEIIKQDDRDSYVNKRVDLTGTLLNNLFRNYFNKVVKDMEKQIIREINNGSWKSTDDYENIINLTNIYKIVKSTTIENGIKRALSTGDFGIKHTNSNKVGVAQVLNRLNYVSSLSHARRISTPTDKSGKLIPPRKLHNTSWGFLCPAETPEGQSVGIVKNLSYMTHLTIHSNSLSLHEYIMPSITRIEDESLTTVYMYDKVKVFINGVWVGITETPQELFMMLKDKKYKGIINIYTSIIFDYKMKEIRVCNDSGRLTRPVLRVKDKNILVTNNIINKLNKGDLNWDNLLTSSVINESVIEYIDPEEQSWSLIATKPKEIIAKSDNIYKYTHCEIHPSTMFGILASCIPFPEHNQSPRNTYQCLDPNESVLLSNGSKIPIKDVKIGDEVVCFNPETLETNYTKVINQYVRETDKKVYKITTLSGREIIATEDHKFMTTEGWREVKNMSINETKIGILPHQNSLTNDVDTSNVILSEEAFIEFFTKKNFREKLIQKYVDELKNKGLLPLYNTNYKLPILARIFGFLLADGSINIYERNDNKFTACSFDFGSEDDVKSFENDVELCGFNKCKYNYSSRKFNEITHSTYAVTHNGILPSILLAIGMSYGKKTENIRKQIPLWIMNGNKLIKREFLSGFQGGDGCKIRWNKIDKGYNFVCGETSQQINPKFLESLVYFMNQCVSLLREFGIEVSNVKQNKMDMNRIKVSYKISDKHINLIKYYDNIGYRYCLTKNNKSFIVIEYLKYKQSLFEEHKKNIENIRKLFDENKTNSSISNELNVKVSYVSDVIRSYKNNRNISMRNLGNNTIELWNEDVTLINNVLFIPIKSIELVENTLVSDITVESEDHSFIAGNNFLSSNCAQAKQAMGVYVTNYENRMDKTAYVLNYPMRPLVDTRIMNMIQLNKIPSGTQVIVAIMTHTGYNQEDSLLINKGSIDRGMSLVTVYHTEKDEDKQKINGDEEIRCKPDATKTKGMKFGNYNKVNSKGIIPENTLVENNDIIIAKVTPIKENRNDHTKVIKFEDGSRKYKTVEETYIDKNYIDRNGEGYNFAKVKIRAVRKPVIGDKFSSRHGQKGTVGNIIPECDMPFTSSGVKPDIIINPHAIPSRMTIGQLKETVLGKVLIELGLFGDGTAFGKFEVTDICNELIKLGYEAHGNELLYNGLTGEQHECSVFMGPVFYQRLKHMVNDKAHSRSIGPMVNLTRQPAEGRSRDGGLRFGEMEKDAMVSHGAARFTRGRMYDASDKYSVFVCKKCGLIASYNDQMHIHHCRTCDNRVDFAYVEIPYACKLLFQELNTMNVVPRLITEH
jgi:DNA-directed RNA polymerase beta subunit